MEGAAQLMEWVAFGLMVAAVSSLIAAATFAIIYVWLNR